MQEAARHLASAPIDERDLHSAQPAVDGETNRQRRRLVQLVVRRPRGNPKGAVLEQQVRAMIGDSRDRFLERERERRDEERRDAHCGDVQVLKFGWRRVTVK